MAFAEALSDFFDTAGGFAIDAVYNAGPTVPVIFDTPYFAEQLENASVESAQTTCLVQLSLVPALAHGDTFVVNGTTYKAVVVRPDGTGLAQVQLEKN